MFKEFQEYTFNIEKDNTLDQHLHIFFTSNHRDKEKVMKNFSVKEFKQFSQYLKNKATQKQYGFDVKLVKKSSDRDDRLYTIGYCNKESKHQRGNLPHGCSPNISPEVLKGVEYYAEYTKLEKVKLQDSHDIKVLSSKNVHITILDYIEKNNIDIEDPLIWHRLASDGIFSDFISDNQKMNIMESIKIYITKNIKKYATLPEINHFSHPCQEHYNNTFSYSVLKDEYAELKQKYEELLSSKVGD